MKDDNEIDFLKRVAKQYDLLLKLHDVKKCVYCGAVAEDKEHVVPFSWLYNGTRRSGRHKGLRNECIVNSCRECNILASNLVFDTFLEKKAYICERIKTRYKKLLNSPGWTDAEISELTGKLKAQVFAYAKSKEYIKLRIENLESGEIPEEVINYQLRIAP